ncbi:MAG: hypothetical protein RLZZ312_864 [Bacteroidota bacterium]|jgi:hypothetical protein
MKKLFTTGLLILVAIGFAQNSRKQNRIKQLQIAFISNKLELTSDEAQKFWPIFNGYDAKQMNLRTQKRLLNFKLKPNNSQSLAERDLAKLLEESEKIETSLQQNRKQFIRDLQNIIPIQKVLIFKQLELDFKQNLLQQLKNRNKD